jgi:hypothetical protein
MNKTVPPTPTDVPANADVKSLALSNKGNAGLASRRAGGRGLLVGCSENAVDDSNERTKVSSAPKRLVSVQRSILLSSPRWVPERPSSTSRIQLVHNQHSFVINVVMHDIILMYDDAVHT